MSQSLLPNVHFYYTSKVCFDEGLPHLVILVTPKAGEKYELLFTKTISLATFKFGHT